MVKNNKKNDSGFQIPNAWDCLPSKENKLLEERSQRYMQYLSTCKTERESIAYIEEIAKKAGFKELPPVVWCHRTGLKGATSFSSEGAPVSWLRHEILQKVDVD